MRKIIFATGNENKMKEIRQILGDMDVEILSMKQAGISELHLKRMQLLRQKPLQK